MIFTYKNETSPPSFLTFLTMTSSLSLLQGAPRSEMSTIFLPVHLVPDVCSFRRCRATTTPSSQSDSLVVPVKKVKALDKTDLEVGTWWILQNM